MRFDLAKGVWYDNIFLNEWADCLFTFFRVVYLCNLYDKRADAEG